MTIRDPVKCTQEDLFRQLFRCDFAMGQPQTHAVNASFVCFKQGGERGELTSLCPTHAVGVRVIEDWDRLIAHRFSFEWRDKGSSVAPT